MKKMTKRLALVLVLVLVVGCFAGCKKPVTDPTGDDTDKTKIEYTYRDSTTALSSNWNPHTWQTGADNLSVYLQTPLVTMSIEDSEEGTFQWVFKAAAAVTDVTKDNQADLTKYQVALPEGQTAEQTEKGYVFEIELNPNMKWQDGTVINADTYIYSMKSLLDPAMKNDRAKAYCSGASAIAGAYNYCNALSQDTYDATVGCYKVDEFTIRYVTQAQIDYNNFLACCTSNWLVYEDLYEKGKDTTGTLTTTDYCTKVENTMSYGPYKLESVQPEKQMVFTQNENYYEYKKNDDGTLSATTEYLVDGENVASWKTTKVIIDVMTPEEAEQAFLKGELSKWDPTADKVSDYANSEQMYKVNETNTMSFFFNTDVDALKEMDKSKGNQNSVVLSNATFRQAMSLAIDRVDWVSATEGYEPAYTLMNEQYFYDIYNDPESSYRKSQEAMQAMVDLYGITYGNGLTYPTLEAAYASITGYNLSEAKALMKEACDELVDEGLYNAGDEIKIRIGYAEGTMTAAEKTQIEKIQEYLNAAIEGSDFGEITLEGVDNIADRYGDVGKGEFAIGYGTWDGAANDPFRHMQHYCDTVQNKIHENACWDPAIEALTIEIDGEDISMTWQEWSQALVGTGPYANADIATKLLITATMEKEFLNMYYRIPLAASCSASLLSYQVSYYTEDYNTMYGFGGLELMTYNYDDAQWAEYVAEEGGTLSYE